jgi:hypothetical protein
MQPGTLALIITVLPLLASNGAYLLSADQGFIPWCIPYIDGCTTISKAARSGNSIFIFRAAMISYGVLLIWFWIYAQHWLDLLYGHKTKTARVILWLGIVGAIFLIVYVDFLGTTGDVNRFMRRYGVMVFYTFTPLAQLLMLKQHYDILLSLPTTEPTLSTIKPRVLHFQLIILLLLLIIAIISTVLDATQSKTYESENIVEWNFSLLLNMYFSGMIFIWKNYHYHLKIIR